MTKRRATPTLSSESAMRFARHFLSGRSAMALHEPSVPLVDALVECANEAVSRDAAEALKASKLAVEVAERLNDAEYTTGGARLRALTSLVFRSRDITDFDLGERSVDRGLEVLRELSYAPDDEIEFLLATGHLYYAMGALKEVLFFADDALRNAREVKDTDRIARSLMLLGCAHAEGGNHKESIAVLWEARDLAKSSRLRFACCQNLSLDYCALGHYRAARSMLDQAEALADSELGTQDKLRLLWARARVDAHAGELPSVVSTLETVAEGFMNLGWPQSFAESVLEIACVFTEQGRWQDALKLASQCSEWFGELGLQRESVAAAAIAGSIHGSAAVERALVALSASIKRRAGRSSSPPSG
ncbi:MAG: hypothetical protein GY769_14450 [bacterium]|nr:hypothetical protein [bacterium]